MVDCASGVRKPQRGAGQLETAPEERMRSLFFDLALLPDGWAEAVSVGVDATGNITQLDIGRGMDTGEHVPGCVLPGVPNLHCHAHQRAMAGLAERAGVGDDCFWSWREAMYRTLARMQPQHLEAVAAQLYVEMLKAGYTSVVEFQYLHHDPEGQPYAQRAEMSLRTLAAAEDAGIGMTSLPVLYCYGGFGGQPPTQGQRRFVNDTVGFLEIFQALAASCTPNPNATAGIAPHSLRAVSRELLGEIVVGRPRTGPVHLHIAEQEREVVDCVAWSGRRPLQWLMENVAVDSAWCLIHATHTNAEELAAIAASAAVVGLCPTTEANLGDGVFDAAAFQEQGGRYGVGSDSNICVSPVQELRWLEYTQRLHHRRRNVLAGGPDRSTGRSLLEHALAGGAQACGRDIGRIAVGARADFIVLDTDHPSLYGRSRDDLLDSWIFAGTGDHVRDVFVGGRCVVADGIHEREKAIEARFRQTLDELAA
jgi:formimidoylglutamate deiminase